MPIQTTWLKRGLYNEKWDGVVLHAHVLESSKERTKWQEQDGNGQYVVLIDLSNCSVLPKASGLKEGAKLHPKDKAHFVLYGGSLFHSLFAGLVSVTGYDIRTVETFEEAKALAEHILAAAEDGAAS
jgi:hypothetical protein